jgi:DNA-binding response OmpR family regulator
MGINAQQANMSRTILLIQDDPEDAGKIRDALLNSNEQSFEVEWVRRCCEGLERLARRRRQAKHRATRIAAVLVDLFLPDSQGIGTFDQLFLAAPQVPILVLSARQDEKVAQLAVQHGAHDYLLKDRLEGYMVPKAVANVLERAASAEALFAEKERARVTLSSIADAVISTDVRSGKMPPVARSRKCSGQSMPPLVKPRAIPSRWRFGMTKASGSRRTAC